MNLSDGIDQIIQTAFRAARPDPELRVDEWATAHMVLPKQTAEPGPYNINRTPMARRVQQVLSPRHPSKRVVCRGASQMFKTQVAMNWMCASMHRAPANILALEPTDSLAKRLSARISQAIKDVKVLEAVVSPQRSRDSRNTVGAKDFEGGTIYIATAGSASNMAEIPARYVFIDEVDRMLESVGGEGDPVALAEARATTFARNCKFFEVSSPTVEGNSKIDELYERGTQEFYAVPCPHCGHHHQLTVENFRFLRDPGHQFLSRAYFVCPECGAEIDERHKGRMLRDKDAGGTAHWVARSQGDGETVSFEFSAFYAHPGSITWLALAREYDRAKRALDLGDETKMIVFYNTRLALSWSSSAERTAPSVLQDRAEAYPLRLAPMGVVSLTAAVDTQPNRLEVLVTGWGKDMERWVVDHQVLWGPPSDQDVWDRLDTLRRAPIEHECGARLTIKATFVDSGGANTQDVYEYTRTRRGEGVFAIKGSSISSKPLLASKPTLVDVTRNGKFHAKAAELWLIGTHLAKDWLYARNGLAGGPGAIHFSDDLPQEFYEQWVAERKIIKHDKRGMPKVEWFKPRSERNEALDLGVYNLAAAHYLGFNKLRAADWDARLAAIRESVAPRVEKPRNEPPPPAVNPLTGKLNLSGFKRFQRGR